MKDCIFCRIIKGELPSSKVYEDELCLAFLDIKPINKGHVLIVPKKHSEFISQLSELELSKIMIVAQKINNAIRKSKIKCEGINYFLADGEAAMQEVPHVHLHVFPRFKNDGFDLKFPKEYGKKSERKELEETAKNIKDFM